jgi:hypothetical protein
MFIRVFIFLLLFSNLSLSQEFDEIDITNFSNTDGWIYIGVTNGFDTYYKSKVGCFDKIILFQHDSKSFYIESPSVEKFESVYEFLKDEFGEEDINVDFIRYGTDVSNDEKFHKAIKEGDATINRIWLIDDIKICLEWFLDYDEGHDMITILSYYK